MSSTFDYSCDVCGFPTVVPGLCDECAPQRRTSKSDQRPNIPNPITCLRCGMLTPFDGVICHHCQGDKNESKQRHLELMDALAAEHTAYRELQATQAELQRRHNARIAMSAIKAMMKLGLFGLVFVAVLYLLLPMTPENPGVAVVIALIVSLLAFCAPKLIRLVTANRPAIAPSLMANLGIAVLACFFTISSWVTTKSLFAALAIGMLVVGTGIAIKWIIAMQANYNRENTDGIPDGDSAKNSKGNA